MVRMDFWKMLWDVKVSKSTALNPKHPLSMMVTVFLQLAVRVSGIKPKK